MRPAILLEAVSKRFRRVVLRTGYTTLKTALVRPLTGAPPPADHVEALRDVDLCVPPGTTLAIIGRNGSGKSTLVRVIAGIYKPDAGRVTTRGRVSALIELGAGFHPEFTGRENIYINGIILGLTKKEVRRRFDEIVHFSELEAAIDSPVRTYSTGMYMRLGFSVAVHVDPEILLVDEVLAVGDEAFVRKCLEKMDAFKRQGKTIVVAGHNLLLAETWCDAAILLDGGRVMAQGPPVTVVEAYRGAMAMEEAPAV